MSPPRLLFPFAILAVLAPGIAFAEDRAETLFKRGLADMEAGRYDAGCPAIEESHRLDPRAGALFTLAECEAKRGRIATALVRYGEYLALHDKLSPQKQRAQGRRPGVARAQVAALEIDVPRLTVSLPTGAPAGTVVARDGVALSAEMLGVPQSLDPGDHLFVVEIPGGLRSQQQVTLARGDRKDLLLSLPRAPEPQPPPPVIPVLPPPPPPTAPQVFIASPPPPEGMSARRKAAFAVGGLGLAGLAVGAVTGALAIARKRDADGRCDEAGACVDQRGVDAGDSMKAFGTASTVAFSIGAAAVGVGVLLLVTDRPPQPAASRAAAARGPLRVTLAPGPGGLTAVGRW